MHSAICMHAVNTMADDARAADRVRSRTAALRRGDESLLRCAFPWTAFRESRSRRTFDVASVCPVLLEGAAVSTKPIEKQRYKLMYGNVEYQDQIFIQLAILNLASPCFSRGFIITVVSTFDVLRPILSNVGASGMISRMTIL